MGNRATYDLSNKTVRAKLRIRPKPYYTSVQPRLTLGWIRPAKSEAGRWLARVELGRNESGHPVHRQRTLGLADDIAPADGRIVLTFQQAARLAADPNAVINEDHPLTVLQAIEAYIAALRSRSKHADGDRSRLLGHMPADLLAMPVVKLTKSVMETWRNGLVREDSEDDPDARRRSMDTANRLLTILRAALNHGLADDSNGIENDRAWRLVTRYKNVGRAREFHFSEPQVLRWINAARAIDPALAHLVEAGFHSGARLGELLACDVVHFDARRAQLHIPRGKTGPRTILLPSEAKAFFARLTAGRAKSEPLLPNAAGERWGRNSYARAIKMSLKAARLDTRASFYTLRHTHASRRIERGQPLLLIAEELGTSIRMLEQTYGKFLKETRRKLIEEGAPTLRGKGRRGE